MESLSTLSKFLGMYDKFKELIRRYGLKWSVNTDDVIIARLLKYRNNNGNGNNELFEWIRKVKQQIPELKTFMDFAVAIGLRFSETLYAYNLIVELDEKGKLNEYYNAEQETLEHFRYRELFLRRTKKAFISIVSKEMVEQVARTQKTLTFDSIRLKIKRRGLKARFSDIRELWASYMVKHLSQPEIDFLQGRISATVFMRNYFNPTWISDLKERTITGTNKMLKLIADKLFSKKVVDY